MVRNEESEPPNHSSPFRRQKDNIMCKFFSIVTEPENHGGQRFYRDWQYRKEHLDKENDSHSLLCKANGLDEDKCNKYELLLTNSTAVLTTACKLQIGSMALITKRS
jgi:hypothetical protein